MDASKTREWHMFLGTREPADAASDMTRLVQRLDDAFDELNYVLRLLAGSPSADLEENLRIARTSLNEGIGQMQHLATEFRCGGTGAA